MTSSGGPGKEVASVTVLGTLSQVGCHGCDGGEHLGRDLVSLLRLDVAVSKYSVTQMITCKSDQGEIRFDGQSFGQAAVPKTVYKITVSWQPEFLKSVLQPFVQLILAEW